MSKYESALTGLGVVGVFLAIPVLFFLIVILSTLLGGVFGWIVGLFFGQTILGILAQFGITGVSMFQVGVFLGFVGSFFKTVPVSKK